MSFAAKRLSAPGSFDHTPSADVAAGEVVVVGTRVGIATSPIKADALGSLADDGNWILAKAAGGGLTFSDGDPVYFDATAQEATDDAGDTFFGFAIGDAADDDATVNASLKSPGSP